MRSILELEIVPTEQPHLIKTAPLPAEAAVHTALYVLLVNGKIVNDDLIRGSTCCRRGVR